MENLFMCFALFQALLFIALELGIRQRIIKDDLIVRLTKVLTVILGVVSLYMAIRG